MSSPPSKVQPRPTIPNIEILPKLLHLFPSSLSAKRLEKPSGKVMSHPTHFLATEEPVFPAAEAYDCPCCPFRMPLNHKILYHLRNHLDGAVHHGGSDFRVVFKTQTLEEETTLAYHGIQHMSNIHTLLMLHGGI